MSPMPCLTATRLAHPTIAPASPRPSGGWDAAMATKATLRCVSWMLPWQHAHLDGLQDGGGHTSFGAQEFRLISARICFLNYKFIKQFRLGRPQHMRADLGEFVC